MEDEEVFEVHSELLDCRNKEIPSTRHQRWVSNSALLERETFVGRVKIYSITLSRFP